MLPLVFVIDDFVGVRNAVVRELRRLPCELRAFGTIEEVRQAAREQLPDLAIIDVHLPDGSGPALALELRELNPQLAVIFISTCAYSELTRAVANDRIFPKPWNATELASAVRRSLADVTHRPPPAH